MLLAKDTPLQNRYEIVRQIAQGGMGTVYEARDKRFGQPVALKRLVDNNNPLLQQAFEREGRILANLSHPALPNVSDNFFENNSQFLVMEYIPGDDLKKCLKEQGHPFPMTQVLDWADQLLDVLEYLHEQPLPIIHRDIKPANIKLSSRGKIILLDFGISKGGQIYTKNLQNRGVSVYGYTEKYAPPEQIEGQGTDERSDLYSLGVTLYELLTNKEPIPALNHLYHLPNRRSLSQQDDDPQSFDNLVKNNPDLSPDVLKVLACAMALDANKRPSNAKEMREMLQRVSTSHAQDTLDSITSIPVPLAEPKEAKTQTVPDKQKSTLAIPTKPTPPTEPLTHLSDDKSFSGRPLWRNRLAVIAMGAVGIVLVLLIAITILRPPADPMFTFSCGNRNTQRVSADDTVTLAPDDLVHIELNIAPKSGNASSGTLTSVTNRVFRYEAPSDTGRVNIDFTFSEDGPATLFIVVSDQGGLCGP